MELKASRACVTQQQTHYIQLKIKRVETPWLIYYSNTRPSFLFTLKPSEVRQSVLKAGPNVSKARLSLSRAQPHVLKQILARVFLSTATLRISDNLIFKKQPSHI